MMLVLLTGCGVLGAPEDTGSPASKKYMYDTNTEIVPESGKWVYQNLSVQSLRCMPLEELLPFTEGQHFKIFQSSTRGFNKKLPGIDESTRCRLTGDGFSCDAIRTATPVEDQDLTLVSDLNTLGVFVDTTRVKGRYKMAINCNGSACFSAEMLYGVTFPCELIVEYVATFE